MYRVSKVVSFCYGHRLLGYPGKCRHLHGHNARATITLEGNTLDTLGMLCDFNEVGKQIRSWIDEEIDHTLLLYKEDPLIMVLEQAGERFYMTEQNPTAEHIAKMIYDWVQAAGYSVIEVIVAETDSCFASYTKNKNKLIE